MHINETFLTPLLRNLIECIEQNENASYEQACKEIENLYKDFSEEEIGPIFDDSKIAGDIDKSLLMNTIHLLSQQAVKHGKTYDFWNEILATIQGEQCTRCVQCKHCREYYWRELGEILFQKANELKEAGNYIPIRNIPEKIERHLLQTQSVADMYFERNQRRSKKLEGCCIVLKGMSSSTPSLMNGVYDTSQFSGGGFYLCYHGIGVVIDPGYHFLDNLHHQGLSVLDIDAVVVTHEHIDHNSDMRLLNDMHHAIYKKTKKKIHWYLDRISYSIAKIYQDSNTGFQPEENVLYPMLTDDCKDEEIPICEEPKFMLKCFRTMHIQKKDREFCKHTFGCQFTVGEGISQRRMVYTSDTSYFPELVQKIDMPDILIANISSIYEDDFMLVKQKQRHLGYYGSYHLLMDIWKKYKKFPGLVLLSEFWNGENDIRFDVTSFLEYQIRKNTHTEQLRIIPAEIGMICRLEDGAVCCSECGKFTAKFLIRRPSGYQEKIQVLCESCIY